MGINIADNFAYNGKKPMDNRTEYATLSAMKSVVDANINEGCMCYNKEDGKYYTFKSTNTVDPTTGKWREFETGGGGQTYNDFTGATASTAGAHGLVPAPSAGDEGKVLFGNGAWGALPSVDLSVLSNEAFQFSTTEKAVGTWTDGKILYAKTVNCGTVNIGESKEITHGISNMDRLAFAFVVGYNEEESSWNVLAKIDNNLAYVRGFRINNTIIKIIGYSLSQKFINAFATMFYTKTTDSPLASDVKFAGVTASGEVILKKDYDLGQELVIGSDKNDVATWTDTGISDPGIGKIIDVKCNGSSGSFFPMSAAIISNKLNLTSPASSHKVRYITLYYTLAS